MDRSWPLINTIAGPTRLVDKKIRGTSTLDGKSGQLFTGRVLEPVGCESGAHTRTLGNLPRIIKLLLMCDLLEDASPVGG